MQRYKWWKNFALGIELDVSGTFIYNGLKAFDSLEIVYYASDIFEILYNLSVGIERLYKVAIIMLEHNNSTDIKKFEEKLKTHNVINLLNRIEKHHKINIEEVHKEFLHILSDFYKEYRYQRFSLSSVPNIELEKEKFIKFIKKHLEIEEGLKGEISFVNTDQVRRFLGTLIKELTREIYNIIKERSKELNIYTFEIRCCSKAHKIFLCDELDFIKERLVKKELILFLMNNNTSGKRIDLLKSFDKLNLDPELVVEYIKGLLSDNDLFEIMDEIEVAYEDIDNLEDRLNFLDIMDNKFLTCDPETYNPEEERFEE